MLNRKAQNQIVSIVLIILLVVAAIAIIGAFVIKTINNASQSVEAGTSSISLSVPGQSVLIANAPGNSKYVNLPVSRNVGEGSLTGVQVVLRDDTGNSDTHQVNLSLKELETKRIELFTSLPTVSSITLVPIFTSSNGKTLYGTNSFSVPVDSSGYSGISSSGGSLVTNPDGSLSYLPSGLRSYLRMNSADGEKPGLFIDYSGNGNNGTCSGASCPTATRGGISGGAYLFDGVNDIISISNANSNVLKNTDPFTISLWLNANSLSTTSYKSVIASESYNNNGFRYGVGSNRVLTFWTTESGGTISLSSVTQLNENQWYHTVITYDGSKASMYLDGVLKSTSVGRLVPNSPSIPFNFGWPIGGKQAWDGRIDEIMIFNRSLTSSEVSDLYNWAK